MVKDTGHIYKYNRSKQPTSTFKKPVLSYSPAHASSASNSTGTYISSQLDNKDITKIKTRTTPKIQMKSTHV